MDKKSLPQLLIGGAIVLFGLGFLLDGLNIWDFSSVMRDWWPLLIILVGVASLLSSPSTPWWPVFIIGAGILLLLEEFDLADIDVWDVIWPIALIIFGVTMFLSRRTPLPKSTDENRSDIFVLFSGVDSANASSKYAGGRISAFFGGVKLDLREAELAKNSATLEVFTAFGGVDLLVPDNWLVQVNGLPLFGGWDDKTKKPSDKNAPTLHIRGTCLFGGVNVKNS